VENNFKPDKIVCFKMKSTKYENSDYCTDLILFVFFILKKSIDAETFKKICFLAVILLSLFVDLFLVAVIST